MLTNPPPLPPTTVLFSEQLHLSVAFIIADLGNPDIDFLPGFFILGSTGLIRAVELHRVSTHTSAALAAVPLVYLAIAAIFPSAREIFVTVHLHRGLTLAAAAVLQMMLARQSVSVASAA